MASPLDNAGLGGVVSTLSDVFINLSGEYPAILSAILILFAVAGTLISGSAAFDVIKLGKRDSGNIPGAAILWKMVGGASMIDLAFWTHVWTSSLWSVSNPLEISAYAGGGGDYTKTAIMAVLGFIVLVGYITLGRAYFMITRLGYLSPESRSDLIGSIISRIFAGSLMVAALHVSKAFDNSTGFNWIPV